MAEAEATIEEAPPQDAAPAAEAEKKPAKEKDAKKKKKGKEVAPVDDSAPSIAAHPRAARSIAQAKSWGALIGFLVGGYESLPTHTLVITGVRAIAFGTILYVAVWAGSVFFWRRLVVVEIKAREQQLLAAVQSAQERRQAPGAGGVR